MAEKKATTKVRKFRIVEVKEITTKDGQKFNAYKTISNGGRKMDVRFVRKCNNIPTEPCVIVVDEDDCNVDTTRQYPILWIKNVQSIEQFERKSNIDEFFDKLETEDDLPF